MGKLGRRLLAVVLAAVLLVGGAGMGTIPAAASSTTYSFIVPVTRQATVPAGYTGIYNASGLNDMHNNLYGDFILMADIDLAGWNIWEPIGTESNPFRGILDGNGYAIKNMSITLDGNSADKMGFIGCSNGAQIKNLGIVNSTVTGTNRQVNLDLGLLVGWGRYTTITNCFSADSSISISTIYAVRGVGGIAGAARVNSSYNASNITVTSDSSSIVVGGVVGTANGYSSSQHVYSCYNTGAITAQSGNAASAGVAAGGIVGALEDQSTVKLCANYGKVNAVSGSNVSSGGVVGGGAYNCDIDACFNEGEVQATAGAQVRAGGIIGTHGSGNITNCYNTGEISVTNRLSFASSFSALGGVTGFGQGTTGVGSKKTSYNIGELKANTTDALYRGGVMGTFGVPVGSGTGVIYGIDNCYFLDTTAQHGVNIASGSNPAAVRNIAPLTAAQMKQKANFEGFDFDSVWDIDPAKNGGYPFLRGVATPDGGIDPQPTTYTITYNANGGTGAPASQTKTQGVTLTLRSGQPSWSGYIFTGWSASSTATAAQWQAGGSYTVDGDATLWAVWESRPQPTQYTVTFNTDGGSTVAPQTVNAGTAITLPAPTKAGFTFKGWSTSNGGNVAYQAGTSYAVNSSVTLYAVWEENQQPSRGFWGTHPRWTGAWWHYVLFFAGFGFIWMWFI